MAQLTIRGIDPAVKRQLKMEAAKHDKSLKDFVLSRLSQDLDNRKKNLAAARKYRQNKKQNTGEKT